MATDVGRRGQEQFQTTSGGNAFRGRAEQEPGTGTDLFRKQESEVETKISRDEDIKHDQPKEDVEEEEEVSKGMHR